MRAAIYARLSDDSASVESQVEDATDYVKRQGWTLGERHVFIDRDRSGFKVVVREGLDMLSRSVDDGDLDVIIMRGPDRLGRNQEMFWGTIAPALKKMHVILAYYGSDRRCDLNTAAGRRDAGSDFGTAEYESGNRSERVRAAVARGAARGRRSGGGPRPFGYDRRYSQSDEEFAAECREAEADGRRLPRRRILAETVNETEAALIREAARRILDGESLAGIVREWTAKGVRTPSGGGIWYPKVLRNILTSGRIAGMREHEGIVTSKEAKWPAIIDEQMHDDLVRVLRNPTRLIGSTTYQGRVNLLTGFLLCGREGCKGHLYGKVASAGRERSYSCISGPGFKGCNGMRIHAEDIESWIVDQVIVHLDSPELSAAQSSQDERSERRAELLDQLENYDRRMTQAREDYADGAIDRSDWMAIRDRITVRRKEVQAEYDKLTGSRIVASVADGKTLVSAWDGWSLDQRRVVLASVIESVTVLPHPAGVANRCHRRSSETEEQYEARRRDWSFEVMTQRVAIKWRV